MFRQLMRMADDHPGKPFLLFEEQSWQFDEVADAALRGANWLAQIGVEPGDRVVIAISNRPLFILLWFSALARGAIAVPISHEAFGAPLQYIVGQSESRVVLCEAGDQSRFADDLRDFPATVHAFADEAAFVNAIAAFDLAAPPLLSNATPASILYTSGTTGQPKGVVVPNRSYLAAGEAVSRAIGITADDRIMTFLPLHHANPQMYSVMSALTTGCSVAIVPKFSASRFLDQAKHYKATGFTYVGTVLSILAKEFGSPVESSLKWCTGGGAPRAVWQEIEAKLAVNVHELYGMTETGGLVTINSAERSRFASVGAPRDDFDVALVDSDDNPLETGGIGEIVVRPKQPCVMTTGYFRKPEETLAATTNLWFHTGDLGRFDHDGFLFFEGRKKELIRRGGEMISPVEIELAALKFDLITDCAAVGVPDDILEEEVKLVVVAKHSFDTADLLAFMRAVLPRHMIPRYVEFASEIPKTATQKIQRFKLTGKTAHTIDTKTEAIDRPAHSAT